MPNVTNYHLSYSLVIPTDIVLLDRDSGMLKLNTELDREKNEWHYFAVQVTDGKTPERTAFAMVNIHVTDVNDNSPQFQKLSHVIYVMEDTYAMSDIGTFNATDKDAGNNATIQYSLYNYTGHVFSINSSTGHLTINGTLDREENSYVDLIVQAEDEGTPPLSATAFVRVEIQDANDHSPQFQRNNYMCSVEENAPYLQICNVTATDDDMGDNGTIVYSIQDSNIPFYIDPIDGPTNTFCIGNNTGEISLCKSMVDSQKPTYVLTVKAEDANLTDTAVVVIQMRNEPASFSQNIFSADIMENGPGGMFLDLNTTEELSGIPVHYTLISVQPPETAFNVNEMTGEVYCSESLDRERENTYTLHVSAEVIRSGQRSKRSIDDSLGQVEVIVNVGDVNDNPPRFPTDTKTVYRVPKSLQLAAKVAELQAIDPDENSTISYRLENNSKLPFFLDGNARLRLKSTLESDSYHLTVSVTDEDGLFSDINITIITIPDEDRLTYVIPMSTQEFEKTEKALIA
ncbi:cadherin EGF LAG seven-pass G-type receptor 2-like [Ylistrum balloti]|uniref:cadherin EGF LAG seven-pass G-type receptor 2-like n=1 Tax=Ylistrum balloti TaxID=509963 RepID=UPI002905902D|nr:cadherin EGF LAG seven-pass G-type receptor 2-like [Ylistrum balloti]